jgi:hypothetical protein
MPLESPSIESPRIELAKIQPKGASRLAELGIQKAQPWGSSGHSESSFQEVKIAKRLIDANWFRLQRFVTEKRYRL